MKDILRSLRIKNNYSQNAVASYLEVSRQMYIKYENGSAEPPLKMIRKLCKLYKVPADVLIGNDTYASGKKDLYELTDDFEEGLAVASPSANYNLSASNESGSLLSELIGLLPQLKLSEKISLLSHLAQIIEKQSADVMPPVLKTKKIKKIPDAQYSSYMNPVESQKLRSAGLAAVREILKNDEW